MTLHQYANHNEQAAILSARAQEVFSYVDDFTKLSSHMSQSSPMMAGASMEISFDNARGQAVGSHVSMNGRVMGIDLFLEEVVTEREPPHHKAWETTGRQRLLVISNYRLGFDIADQEGASKLRVSIDYNLPQSSFSSWLGYLFGTIYAKWCVQQMTKDARNYFSETRPAMRIAM